MLRLTNLLFLVLLSSVSYSQIIKDVYENGKPVRISKYSAACNCEHVTEYYYPEGILWRKMTYLHTADNQLQIDGEDIVYFENGIIAIYYFWKNGAPDGRIYSNFKSGKLGYEKYFIDKFKYGTWKFYNEDGSIKQEIIFDNGKTTWDSNDDYAVYKFYFNKVLIYIEKYEAGKKVNTTITNKVEYDNFLSQKDFGKQLFMAHCGRCHFIDKDMVGPMLKGITEKRKENWLTQWIVNADSLYKAGDKTAEKLYPKWNYMAHPKYHNLSKYEVQGIIEYMKTF